MIPLRQLADGHNPDRFKGFIIALDPGETTGFCIMRDLCLTDAGQLKTGDLDEGYLAINDLFGRYSTFDEDQVRIICEDYRVYSWKTEQHNWAGLHTPKLIGIIHAVAMRYGLTIAYEMAVTAKQFCDDEKLKAWGMWQAGQRHARDAIRHAIYQSIFVKV